MHINKGVNKWHYIHMEKVKDLSRTQMERSVLNPEILYQELNLLKIEGYAFSFDPRKRNTGNDACEFMQHIDDPEGRIKERPVTISPSAAFGRPSPVAYKILNAIFKKLSEYGISIPETVPFTFRDLAERIGWTTFGGRQAKEIYHALQQLKGTDITCWGYNKETKQWD